MTRCDDMRRALACREPVEVPVWEIEFHLWNEISSRRMTLGRAFADLTQGEQERALHANAEIIVAVAGELGFSAVTAPGGYWEHAPGHPAYYWLPDPARDEQIRGGHRFWIAPEAQPWSYELDNVSYESAERIAGGVRVRQAAGPITGLVKQMEITLASDSNTVTVTHTLTNAGGEAWESVDDNVDGKEPTTKKWDFTGLGASLFR